MKKWPHKCPGWKASESDPSFCANCGNIASGHTGPTPGAPRSFRVEATVTPNPTDGLAHQLAEDFLRWKLPDSVCADLCATKQGPGRIGTNLLSYIEARQMMQDVVLAMLHRKGFKL